MAYSIMPLENFIAEMEKVANDVLVKDQGLENVKAGNKPGKGKLKE